MILPTFNGLRVIVSVNALEATNVRTFPASRHRSARIHKKLVKRHGSEFRMQPAIFRTTNAFIMHPAMWAKLQAATELQARRSTP